MRPDSRRVTDSPGGTVLSSPAEKRSSLIILIISIVMLMGMTICVPMNRVTRDMPARVGSSHAY